MAEAGDAALVEHQLAGWRAAKAHLVQLLRYLEPGIVGFDDKRRNALGALGFVSLGIKQDHIGDRPVRDVNLRAVDDIVFTVAARGGGHGAKRIRARAGFGQPQGSDQITGTQARHILLYLLLGAVAQQVVQTQVVVCPVRQTHRRIPFRDHFGHQRLGEFVLTGAAHFLGRSDPQKAEFSHLLEQIVRPPILSVHTRLQRVQHLARYAIHVIDDLSLLTGQRVVCPDGLQIGHHRTVLTVHGFPPEQNVRLTC